MPTSTAPPGSPVAELVRASAGTPLTAPGIRALASRPVAELQAALASAVEQDATQAAARLALALSVCGDRIKEDHVVAAAQELESIQLVGPLVYAAEADPVDVWLRILEVWRGDPKQRAAMLFVAAHDGSDPERPPHGALLFELRRLARRPGPVDRAVAFAAAHLLGDPHLLALVGSERSSAGVTRGVELLGEVVQMARGGPLDALPEREAKVTTGYTVKRAGPAVGRNDPCPCGSGKKYKKCCALSPGGAEVSAETIDPGSLTDSQVRDLAPGTLAALEPSQLPTGVLIVALRALSHARRWRAVERFISELDRRPDLPGGDDDASGWREEVVEAALDAGAFVVAEHHLSVLGGPEGEFGRTPRIALRLAFAYRELDRFDHVEVAAHRALAEEDDEALIDLAFTLLEVAPAIGIPFARGALAPGRYFDNEMLLDTVVEARDRLGLPPWESWWDVLDASFGEEPAATTDHEASAEHTRLRAELTTAQAQSRAASAQLVRAQQRIAELDLTLEVAQTKSAVSISGTSEAPSAPDPGMAAERRRLKLELENMRRIIAEGQDERRALRKQLAELEPRTARPALPVRGEHDQVPDESRVFLSEPAATPRGVLVPEFAPRAARALLELETATASLVLGVVADLAAARPNAWNDTKRLERVRQYSSARAGIHHRVLFTLQDQTLRIEDIIHRRDLEKVVARL